MGSVYILGYNQSPHNVDLGYNEGRCERGSDYILAHIHSCLYIGRRYNERSEGWVIISLDIMTLFFTSA